MVGVGDAIADFTTTGTDGSTIHEYTLSDVAADGPVLLVFYVYDFSPVCTTQLGSIDDLEFFGLDGDVTVLGVSSDGPYSHQRFIEANDITFPLLTDERGDLYERVGLIEETEEGRKRKRGLVLLDESLTIRFWWQAEDNWDDWEADPLVDAHEALKGFAG